MQKYTFLSTVSPFLKVVQCLFLDKGHMAFEVGNCQASFQHLLLLQKHLTEYGQVANTTMNHVQLS